MGKERIGGNSGDQGPMDLWERLAVASDNYSEQQPGEAEVYDDAQGGDETRGEQGTAVPMTFEEFGLICATIDEIYDEYGNKKSEIKPTGKWRRQEILADQERQIKKARKKFDRRCEKIGEATSARIRQIEESVESAQAHDQYDQALALIKEESSKRMKEAMAPLVEADKISDETLRQFISSLNERQKRSELTLNDIQLAHFVINIAKRNSQRRKDFLRANAGLECEDDIPLEAELSEVSPRIYLTNKREALSEQQHPVLQAPLDVLQWRSQELVEGYVRAKLEQYVDNGLIPSQYSIYIDEEKFHHGVYSWEVYVESDCGGFILSENTTGQLKS